MNLIRGLSSEFLGGLSNGMIYKEKIFCFETVFIHGIACALKWRVALVGAFLYWALLTPSLENIFRYWKYTRRWTHLRFSWEEGPIWIYLCFCKFWVETLLLYM